MADIRWTEEAVNWLKEIHDYIAQDSPSAAAKVISSIYENVQLLKSRRIFCQIAVKRIGYSGADVALSWYKHPCYESISCF